MNNKTVRVLDIKQELINVPEYQTRIERIKDSGLCIPSDYDTQTFVTCEREILPIIRFSKPIIDDEWYKNIDIPGWVPIYEDIYVAWTKELEETLKVPLQVIDDLQKTNNALHSKLREQERYKEERYDLRKQLNFAESALELWLNLRFWGYQRHAFTKLYLKLLNFLTK